MGHRVRVLIPLRATQITYSHHWERVLPAAAASERRRRRRRLTREKEAVGGQLSAQRRTFFEAENSKSAAVASEMVAREAKIRKGNRVSEGAFTRGEDFEEEG